MDNDFPTLDEYLSDLEEDGGLDDFQRHVAIEMYHGMKSFVLPELEYRRHDGAGTGYDWERIETGDDRIARIF